VIKNRPVKGYELILLEFSDDSTIGAFGRREIERSDPEFEHKFAALSWLKVIRIGGVCVGQLLDPGLAAPDHRPLFVESWGEDVVILCVDPMEREMRILGLLEKRI